MGNGTVFESDDSNTLSGNCDVDVNECASKPCKNGATCSQSTTESKVSIDTYQCTCKPGYSNGWCEYDYISEGTANCTVFESDDSKTLSGNCDVDVNECAQAVQERRHLQPVHHGEQGVHRHVPVHVQARLLQRLVRVRLHIGGHGELHRLRELQIDSSCIGSQ